MGSHINTVTRTRQKELNQNPSIVLLSGGLDSAVALYWALDRGYRVDALTFDYHRRSHREIDACRKIAKIAGVSKTIIRLPFLREVEDLPRKLVTSSLKNAPSAYIPSRNAIFYGIASYYADLNRTTYIIGGHNQDDLGSFPDASRDFLHRYIQIVNFGKKFGNRKVKVVLPLGKLGKSGVVKLGQKLGVPFKYTWSCYKAGAKPCGNCPACLLRKEAFDEAGIEDPLRAGT